MYELSPLILNIKNTKKSFNPFLPTTYSLNLLTSLILVFLSPFLWNYFLCWDRWNGDVTPTLGAALLLALGQVLIWVVSGLVWGPISDSGRSIPYSFGIVNIAGPFGTYKHFCLKLDSNHSRQMTLLMKQMLYWPSHHSWLEILVLRIFKISEVFWKQNPSKIPINYAFKIWPKLHNI